MGKFVIKPSSDFSIVRIEITADVAKKRPNRYALCYFVNCRQFMYLVISLLVLRIWDLVVSVPDHCLSFYFVTCILTLTTLTPGWYDCGTFRVNKLIFWMNVFNRDHINKW